MPEICEGHLLVILLGSTYSLTVDSLLPNYPIRAYRLQLGTPLRGSLDSMQPGAIRRSPRIARIMAEIEASEAFQKPERFQQRAALQGFAAVSATCFFRKLAAEPDPHQTRAPREPYCKPTLDTCTVGRLHHSIPACGYK